MTANWNKSLDVDFNSVDSVLSALEILVERLGQLPKKQRQGKPTYLQIDFNDTLSLKGIQNKIQSRLGEIYAAQGESNRQAKERIFAACKSIYDTPIRHLYIGTSTSFRKDYYVYVHTDTTQVVNPEKSGVHAFLSWLGISHIPFYVGKGKGNRKEDLNRNGIHKKYKQRIEALGGQIQVLKIKESLSEADALALESKLIDILGLKTNAGLLTNLDEGHAPKDRRKLYLPELMSLRKLNTQLYASLE